MSFPDLFDHFDHVYIVNLPYRDDRRHETIADFARVGVTIPNAHITFFEASRPTEKGEFPSIGSLGNFLSQTRVLADALEKGFERILICEDDLQFNDLHDTTVAKVLADLKTTDWSIAALGYLEPETPPTDTIGLIDWAGGTRGTQFWAIQGDSVRAFHDYLELVRSRPSGPPKAARCSLTAPSTWSAPLCPAPPSALRPRALRGNAAPAPTFMISGFMTASSLSAASSVACAN